MDAKRRRWLWWALSLLGAVVFLALASTRIELWPSAFTLPKPWFVAAAAAIHVPYAFVRALRLRYVFDPRVETASDGAQARLSRRVLYGSGFVSFFVLLVLPLKLGELSRPMLLARNEQPGLGLSEAVGGVALERLVDGLVIVAMLFGGLALSEPRLDAGIADVRAIGWSMLGVFVVGLAGLLIAARAPQRASEIAASIGKLLGQRVRDFARNFTLKVAETMHGVLALQHALPFVLWSLVYWAITTAQLWLVLEGCGVHVGFAAAAAIVSIVGLSIQLPGGPAQAGTFQVGMSVALSLFLDPEAIHSNGSSFAAVMYVLQFVGAGVMALPGLWLLARATPQNPSDAPSPPP